MATLYKVKTLTEPTELPVSLNEAKSQLVVEHTDDDLLIRRYMAAAVNHVESATGLSLVRQQKRLYLDRFANEMRLPNGPVEEITQIQYVDTDGNTQTLSSAVYAFNNVENYVRLAYGQTWPSVRVTENAVWIDYWAGYYDSTTSPIDQTAKVPQAIKDAIYMIVADLYKNREATTDIQNYENPAVNMMLGPFRVYVQ